MTTILFSAPYMIPIFDRLKPVFERYGLEVILARVQERLDEQELLAYAGQYDGAICGDDRYTARILQACSPRLKVISKWGTGIDSIDQTAAFHLGIQVYRTPGAFTLPVADSVFGYILAFARQQPWLDRAMKAGVWDKIPGRSLSECTLGVVGVGAIGKAVIQRGRAFGMRLIGNDIIDIDPEFIAESGLIMTSLNELLEMSDFVSLHCDLNPSSFHLMNQDTLSLMKSTAVLINTARGPVVFEDHLIEALRNHKIAGAGLDVYENEPLPMDSPLLQMKNVLLAPHNANSSPAAWKRVHTNTFRNLLIGLEIIRPDDEFTLEVI